MSAYIGPKQFSQKKAMEKLLKVKGLSALKADLQKVFNEFIRLRDTQISQGRKFFTCISCGQPKELFEMHAGHFFPVGGHEAVRFNEDNVHGQCKYCNYFKHGNPVAYKKNLIKKIGQERFDKLEIRSQNRSNMMRFEVEYLIGVYKEKVNDLKK